MPRYMNGGYNGGYEMRRGGRRRDSRGRYMTMGNYPDQYPYYEPIYREPQMRGNMRAPMMGGGYSHGGNMQMGYAQHGNMPEQLDHREMHEWVNSLETMDMNGNIVKRGEKFTEQQAMDMGKKIGVKFDKFSEKTYWATLNMLNAMLYAVIGDNPDYIARIAKAWLCNENEALMGDEKLCEYYYSIVCGE